MCYLSKSCTQLRRILHYRIDFAFRIVKVLIISYMLVNTGLTSEQCTNDFIATPQLQHNRPYWCPPSWKPVKYRIFSTQIPTIMCKRCIYANPNTADFDFSPSIHWSGDLYDDVEIMERFYTRHYDKIIAFIMIPSAFLILSAVKCGQMPLEFTRESLWSINEKICSVKTGINDVRYDGATLPLFK